jgi:hypothetical protein
MLYATVLSGTANLVVGGIYGISNLRMFAAPHSNDCCLVMVKQSNNFPIKQAFLLSISQTNNAMSVSQTVNTNVPHYLDCLTVDRPGPDQTRLLIRMGFLPVSIDHRLCPETRLAEGPMVDVCDALHWARFTLPSMDLGDSSLRPDGGRVVVVGWSSGGQLAMSLAWTAPQRGLEPPAAILAFYPPTDYDDECKSYLVLPSFAR